MPASATVKDDVIQDQILQAAIRLFATFGLAKVTMEDVAKAIGKTRGSVYYYYKNKYEILDAVIDLKLTEVRKAIKNAVTQAGTVEEKINAFFRTKLQTVRDKHSLFDSLESDLDADTISNFNKIKIAHHDSTLKWENHLFEQILKEGIMKDELKPIKKEEMDTLIFVLISTLHGLKREMRLENNVRNIEPAVDQFTRMVIHGLHK